MAKHRIYKRGGLTGEVSINLTPMVDCTFLLIVFFIITSQFASQALPPLKLHRPEESQAIPTDQARITNRVIVNVLATAPKDADANPALAGRADRYEIGGNRIRMGDTGRLGDILRAWKDANPGEELHLEIRADHRVSFGDVAPVMHAAADAGIVNMNITALTAAGE